MKLTKYIHACVLVEDEDHTALFDPGDFSWKSGLFRMEALTRLDYVMITHEHSDHFSEDFVKAILEQFPEVHFFGPQTLMDRLRALGAKNTSSESNSDVEIFALPHASMSPLTPDPNVSNVAFHYKKKVSHAGDNHSLTEAKDVLFISLAGPWGATIDGVRMANELKPRVIVPVHDWMWNEDWRAVMYARMEDYFSQQNIRFVKAVDGEPFEV